MQSSSRDALKQSPLFAVTLCTARREKMLASALQSLSELSVPEGGRVSIIVVENDSHGRSSHVIDAIQKTSPFPIGFFVETNIGIPFARNRVLAEAIAAGADWIAMIDDDERVPKDWLIALHRGCLTYDAEVATGPIVQVPDGQPPGWWKPVADSRDVTGAFRRDAYTNNVLFSSRLSAADGLNLKFDPRFLHGAEDIDFFRRAYDKGVRIVTVAEASVIEDVPAARLAWKRSLQRNYMIAASNSFFRVVHEGRGKAARDRLPSIIRRLIVGFLLIVAGVLLWPFTRKTGKNTATKGASSIAKALGSFSGVIGRTSNYYNKVDGA